MWWIVVHPGMTFMVDWVFRINNLLMDADSAVGVKQTDLHCSDMSYSYLVIAPHQNSKYKYFVI